MHSCNFSPFLRPACCCLSLGLFLLLAGCGQTPHSVDHAEVSGKVLFQGKPLPGGRVNFLAINGGFASSADIDENGNYQINAPVGDVEIAVTNQMLKAKTEPKKGSLAPKEAEAKQKEADGKKHRSPKGRYVRIPRQYEDPHASGLKYTVKRGAQTHDIELTDMASSPSVPIGH